MKLFFLLLLPLLSFEIQAAENLYLNVCGGSQTISGKYITRLAFRFDAPLSLINGTIHPGEIIFINHESTLGVCRSFKFIHEQLFISQFRAKADRDLQPLSNYCDFSGVGLTVNVETKVITPQQAVVFNVLKHETPFIGNPTRLIYFIATEKEQLETDQNGNLVALISKCERLVEILAQ